MPQARKKLHSQSGASILMALLLLLVCTVVSSVVLSASLSSTMVRAGNRDSQQAYLTVSSAAQLFADELEQCRISNSEVVYYAQSATWTADKDGRVSVNADAQRSYTRINSEPIVSSSTVSGVFAEQLSAAVAAINSSHSVSSEVKKSFVISVEGMDDVAVEFCMRSDYSVEAVFCLAEGNSYSSGSSYWITVKAAADCISTLDREFSATLPLHTVELFFIPYDELPDENGVKTAVDNTLKTSPADGETALVKATDDPQFCGYARHEMSVSWPRAGFVKGGGENGEG